MIHARPDYNVIQDMSKARAMAALFLIELGEAGVPNSRLRYIQELARDVLDLKPTDVNPTMLDVEKHLKGQLNIAKDEPVFIVRARDPLAAETTRYWGRRAHEEGVAPKMVLITRVHADLMHKWPVHILPDLPGT